MSAHLVFETNRGHELFTAGQHRLVIASRPYSNGLEVFLDGLVVPSLEADRIASHVQHFGIDSLQYPEATYGARYNTTTGQLFQSRLIGQILTRTQVLGENKR